MTAVQCRLSAIASLAASAALVAMAFLVTACTHQANDPISASIGDATAQCAAYRQFLANIDHVSADPYTGGFSYVATCSGGAEITASGRAEGTAVAYINRRTASNVGGRSRPGQH